MLTSSPEKRSPFAEIHDLVTASLLGHASPDDLIRMETIVRESDQARDIYLAYIAETDVLRTWSNQVAEEDLAGEIDPTAILELLDEVEAASERDAVKRAAERTKKELEEAARHRQVNKFQRQRANRRPEPIVIPWSAVYATIGAAAAALVLLVHSYWPQSERRPLAPAENVLVQVATVTGSVRAQWGDQQLPATPGTRLTTGSLDLVRGTIEVRLDDGPEIVLESPATLELLSANSVRLVRGKLVGRVEGSPTGFVVKTPFATFVDLGTEFGIAIDGRQATDVQVFEGKIEAQIRDSGHPVSLAKGRSVRVVHSEGRVRMIDVPINPNQFIRNLSDIPTYDEAVCEAKPILYWRFEEAVNGLVRNEMGDSLHGVIQTSAASDGPKSGQSSSINEENGQGNRAVPFDPSIPGLVVVCDEPGVVPIPGNYSIEFWMNPVQQHRGVLASLGVQVIGNKNASTPHGIVIEVCGPVTLASGSPDSTNREGHLRFLHQSPPESDQRTGTSCFSRQAYEVRTWQHVVAIKDGPEMRLYMNGKLSGRARDSSATPSNLTLHVGQLHRYHQGRPFQGQIDEFAIYDRALTEKEIHTHFELGRPFPRFESENQP